MTRFAIPIALAVSLVGAAAAAQQFVPGGTFLARWDANKDGTVTLAEIETGRAALFDTYDKNGDGVLSSAEFDQIVPQSANARQANSLRGGQQVVRYQIDANGDGLIDKDEYVSGAVIWRDRMDTNGDGTLTAADFGRGGRGMGRGGGQGRGMRWNNG